MPPSPLTQSCVIPGIGIFDFEKIAFLVIFDMYLLCLSYLVYILSYIVCSPLLIPP
jgi:hypothetical protein